MTYNDDLFAFLLFCSSFYFIFFFSINENLPLCKYFCRTFFFILQHSDKSNVAHPPSNMCKLILQNCIMRLFEFLPIGPIEKNLYTYRCDITPLYEILTPLTIIVGTKESWGFRDHVLSPLAASKSSAKEPLIHSDIPVCVASFKLFFAAHCIYNK